jgi:hypothetical protein
LTTTVERYHDLDALRAFAMFLGIMIHAAMSFITVGPPIWACRDNEADFWADMFIYAVHDFRMQTFFLMAGFFGALLVGRYGVLKTALHRFKRIVIPLVVFGLLLSPTLGLLWVYAEFEQYQAHQEPFAWRGFYFSTEAVLTSDSQFSGVAANYYRSLAFLEATIPFHLWFLYYLAIFFVIVLPLAGLVRSLKSWPVIDQANRACRWVLTSRFRWIILAIPTTLLTMLMPIPMADTPTSWVPNPVIVVYYLFFFGVGWVLFHHRDRLADFSRGWCLLLISANVMILPSMFLTMQMWSEAQSREGYFLLAAGAASLYTWMMIMGLMGAFRVCLQRERAWVRYLSDSSYWCYLVHLILVIWLAIIMVEWNIPGPIKFVLILTFTMPILVLSYHCGVRRTWIGLMLNGPRNVKKVL